MKNIMENLPQILSMLRVQKRLSQEYVANKLGVSQGQYSKMESGQKEFPISKLIVFAALVGLKPMGLLECLLIGTAKPEETIRKLVHEINNRPASEEIAEAKKEEEYRILADYFEKKYFSLYREYLKLCEMRGIQSKRKLRGGK